MGFKDTNQQRGPFTAQKLSDKNTLITLQIRSLTV